MSANRLKSFDSNLLITRHFRLIALLLSAEFALVNYASRKDVLKAKKRAEAKSHANLMNPAFPNAMFQNNASGIGPLSNYGMTNAMGPLGEWPVLNEHC